MKILPQKIKQFGHLDAKLTDNDIAELATIAAIYGAKAWGKDKEESPLNAKELKLVNTFRKKVKHYLFHVAQGARCCFCGYDIDENKGSHDLEHLIAKDGKTTLVFNLKNLALSCRSCNGPKFNKKTTVGPICPNSDKFHHTGCSYLIIHPHLDEWKDHLKYDKYDRVVSKNKAKYSKGQQTILICGINRKNGMRLADHFDFLSSDIDEKERWLEFYQVLADKDESKKKTKFKKFANTLLNLQTDPAAPELLKLIRPLL